MAEPSEESTVIELVEVEINGRKVFVDPRETQLPVVATPDGRIEVVEAEGEAEHLVAEVPKDRFAAKPNAKQLERMIEAINAAESGEQRGIVMATPDGKLRLRDAGGEERLVAQLPEHRFAASIVAEQAEVARIDPHGHHWRHTSTFADRASDDIPGWMISLENDFGDQYLFFTQSEPVSLYEAQLVRPKQLDLPGHDNHMVSNGVVCLNDTFGVRTLTELHGALAKWMFYSGCVRRGIDKPYSR